MYCDITNQIINICNTDYKYFFSKPNVQGIACGYKYIKGINTLELCINVYVLKKVANNCLSTNSLIPPLYKNFKTDVIETGIFEGGNYSRSDECNYNRMNFNTDLKNATRNNNSPFPLKERIRPIKPGYCMSVANPEAFIVSTGTFGYIVIDNKGVSKTYCLLSNNETFADLNRTSIGGKILQPSIDDGGKPETDVVANLLRYIEIKFSNRIPITIEEFNVIDAAIAAFSNTGVIQLIDPFIPLIGIPTGKVFPTVGQSYKWTGVRNNVKGNITAVGGVIKISYLTETAWFNNVILGEVSSSNGIYFNSENSGAIVCDSNNKVLGLLFGSNSPPTLKYNCICNIYDIEKLLDVTLLTV